MNYEEARSIWISRKTGEATSVEVDATPQVTQGAGGKIYLKDLQADRTMVQALHCIASARALILTDSDEWWRPDDEETDSIYEGPMREQDAEYVLEEKDTVMGSIRYQLQTPDSEDNIDHTPSDNQWPYVKAVYLNGETLVVELEALLLLWPSSPTERK